MKTCDEDEIEREYCERMEREYDERNPLKLECFCKYYDKMCVDCEYDLEQEKEANKCKLENTD